MNKKLALLVALLLPTICWSHEGFENYDYNILDFEDEPSSAIDTFDILVPPDPVLANCSLTPFIELSNKGPKEVPTTNNLIRKTGSPLHVAGKYAVISGRILDRHCVPVADANVEIWEPNSMGIYQYYEAMHDNQNKLADSPFFTRDFVGAGKTTTDNLGWYNFVVLIPGGGEKDAPKINFRVKHPDFKSYTTIMLFDAEGLKYDIDAKKIHDGEERRKLVSTAFVDDDKDAVYFYDITLPGENSYRRY